ncbi:MAG: beta-lactamase family protein [bacterium]|nr:beta-lactamase family protein [bacterium]
MRRVMAMVAALGLVPGVAGAQAAPRATMDDAVAAIAAFGPRALADQGAPGMSVAITDRTHTIRILTFGYADVASKAPVTPETRFPIGSISKSMTSLALLHLHDRGLVALDAPVRRYLPWWRLGGGDDVRIHQLLSHTGGVPDDYTFDGGWMYEVAALRSAHVLSKPGTTWSYSNDGYATLGAVIEAVSGHSWQDEVRSLVFAPNGMTHSSAVFTPENMSDVATGYLFRESDRVALPPHPALMPAQAIDFVNPAGSVISTPGDMAAYMRAYLNGGVGANGARLVSAASFAAMTRADRLNDGKPAGSAEPVVAEWPAFYRAYGYGLSVFSQNGDRLVGHTGGISGYTSCMQINLTRGFGVVALSNLVEAPLHPCAIVKYAMAVLRAQQLGEALPPAPTAPPIAAPTARAADYAESYHDASGARVRVVAQDGGAKFVDGAATYALEPRGDDLFWTDDPRCSIYYVAFTRDAHKRVDGFTCGAAFFANARYAGPMRFAHPKAWDALAGRYETNVWGSPLVMRVVVVKGQLTVDGLEPLVAQHDGSYRLGDSVLRFDTLAGGKMQRLMFDGGALYRVELP